MQRMGILSREDTHLINSVITSSIVLLAITVASVYLYRDDKYAILALGGLVFLVRGSWRVWMLPAIYLAYVIAIPRDVNELNFPVFFHPLTFMPVFLVMIILLFADRVLYRFNTPRSVIRSDYVGTIIAAFISWTILIYLYGMSVGNSTRYLFFEISIISMYLSYYYWRSLFRHKGHIVAWNWLILGAGVIAGVELFWYIFLTFTDIMGFILLRTLNRQPMITLISVPLSLTFILTRKTIWTKLLGTGLLLITLMHTFLSQQRSIWLGVAIVGFIYFTLFLFRKGYTAKKLLVWSLVMLMIAASFYGMLVLGAWILKTDLTTLLTRWEDVKSLSDSSFQMRIFDLNKAIHDVGDNWFLGLGGGKLTNWIHTGWNFYYFDISYGMAYFKGGIPLLFLMTLVYIGALTKTFTLYIRSKDTISQLLGITYTSTLFGVLFVSIFNTGLLFYRHIIVWMLIIASTTVLLEQQKTKSGVSTQL